MPMPMLHLLAVWLVVAACCVGRTRAVVCPETGEEAPAVVTFMASPTKPSTDAWIVTPNCVVTKILDKYDYLAVPRGSGVERIASVPTKTEKFDMVAFSFNSLDLFVFPPNLPELTLGSELTLTTLSKIKFPTMLKKLRLFRNLLSSLKGATFPAGLTFLDLQTNKLTAIDYSVLPAQLQRLDLTNNPITKVEQVTFPSSLLYLYLGKCSISSFRGNKWPPLLKELTFVGNPVTNFEIRESDVAIFTNLVAFAGDISQGKCLDPSADMRLVKGMMLCVISDGRFEAVYGGGGNGGGGGGGVVPSPPTVTKEPSPTPGNGLGGSTSIPGGTTSTTSRPGAGSGAKDDAKGGGGFASSSSRGADGSGKSAPGKSSSSREAGSVDLDDDGRVDNTSSSGGAMAAFGGSSTNTTDTTASSRRPGSPGTSMGGSRGGGTVDGDATASKASSSSPLLIVAVVAAIVVATLAALVAYRRVVANKKARRQQGGDLSTDGSGYASEMTPSTLSKPTKTPPMDDSDATSQEYLVNDVRKDRQLTGFRIELRDLHISKAFARGGFGVIFRGSFLGRDVAIKQMLPGTWQDEQTLSSFMDEIRLCATLEHPRIVSFVGIAWSSLRDLSVVIEYMAGGDLHGVLHNQDLPPSPKDWSQPWTSSKIKPKISIAQDVTEAVVYLHSYNNPILHRDLKAKNVLLDLEGNAKLSDFGISRELTLDETMTSEVGTAAWIAPEVLRGERYSEKADIYSLGVVLEEMDKCRHPYEDEPSLPLRTSSRLGDGDFLKSHNCDFRGSISAAQKNTQIAVLVSTGRLRPSVGSACPQPVAALAARCLHFDADDRPTAMQVNYALRQIYKESACRQKFGE